MLHLTSPVDILWAADEHRPISLLHGDKNGSETIRMY